MFSNMIAYLDLQYRRGLQNIHPSERCISNRSPEASDHTRRTFQRHWGTLDRAPTELSIPFDPATQRTCGGLVVGTLARSRDHAKRLLRSCTPSTAGISVLWHIGSSSSLEVPTGSQPGEEMAAVDTRRGSARPSSIVGGPISGMVHRPSLVEDVRTASQISLASTNNTGGIPELGEERPIASGNGVSLSIALAEPVLFLQGFDQSELGNQTTTMLRGSFHLRVSKSAKIKTVTLAFRGRAETEWPEGEFL